MFLKKILTICILSLGLLNPTFANINRDHQTIQNLLDQTRKKYDFTAMAITIIAPKILKEPISFYSGTIKKGGRALQSTDYFQIGSNTKSFIAATLVKLQSEGKLSLNDKVTKWLPEYTLWKEVKISNLLHNNSGLKSYTQMENFLKGFEADKSKQYTLNELLSYVQKEPLLFNPGESWDYSNTNWVAAAMIAEKASGKKINDLLMQYFFSPLHLKNTLYWPYSYSQNPKILPRMIHGYTDEGEDTINTNISWGSSAGAIIATNEDLARWTYDLFHGKALNKDELKFMQEIVSVQTGKPVIEGEGYGLGIGFRISKKGKFWVHEGHTDGFHSMFAWFPEQDVTIVIQGNGLRESNYVPVLEDVITILNSKKNK